MNHPGVGPSIVAAVILGTGGYLCLRSARAVARVAGRLGRGALEALVALALAPVVLLLLAAIAAGATLLVAGRILQAIEDVLSVGAHLLRSRQPVGRPRLA